jgi:hypothetical protein
VTKKKFFFELISAKNYKTFVDKNFISEITLTNEKINGTDDNVNEIIQNNLEKRSDEIFAINFENVNLDITNTKFDFFHGFENLINLTLRDCNIKNILNFDCKNLQWLDL